MTETVINRKMKRCLHKSLTHKRTVSIPAGDFTLYEADIPIHNLSRVLFESEEFLDKVLNDGLEATLEWRKENPTKEMKRKRIREEATEEDKMVYISPRGGRMYCDGMFIDMIVMWADIEPNDTYYGNEVVSMRKSLADMIDSLSYTPRWMKDEINKYLKQFREKVVSGEMKGVDLKRVLSVV